MVQWFNGSDELGSTTGTKVILIVGESQLIVNTCTQVHHHESYGKSWMW